MQTKKREPLKSRRQQGRLRKCRLVSHRGTEPKVKEKPATREEARAMIAQAEKVIEIRICPLCNKQILEGDTTETVKKDGRPLLVHRTCPGE